MAVWAGRISVLPDLLIFRGFLIFAGFLFFVGFLPALANLEGEVWGEVSTASRALLTCTKVSAKHSDRMQYSVPKVIH